MSLPDALTSVNSHRLLSEAGYDFREPSVCNWGCLVNITEWKQSVPYLLILEPDPQGAQNGLEGCLVFKVCRLRQQRPFIETPSSKYCFHLSSRITEDQESIVGLTARKHSFGQGLGVFVACEGVGLFKGVSFPLLKWSRYVDSVTRKNKYYEPAITDTLITI